MKKDQISSELRNSQYARIDSKEYKPERRTRRIKKISEKTKRGLQRAYSIYQHSGAFSENQLAQFKESLVKAAQKRKIVLENELENNGVDICSTLEGTPQPLLTNFELNSTKSSLVTQVAHGRTFGRALTKCPACQCGDLNLEIREGRYICNPLQFSMPGNAGNCGFVFEIQEIQHAPWIHNF